MVVIGIGIASLALAIIATWGDSPIPVGVGVVAGIITVFDDSSQQNGLDQANWR